MTAHYHDPDWDAPVLTQKKLPFYDRAIVAPHTSVASLKGLLETHNLTQFVRLDHWKDRPDQVTCLDHLLSLSGNVGFQADTGTGKTNLGLLVALAHAHRVRKPTVLFVVPRVDLLPQHAGAVSRYFSIDPNEIVQVTGTLHDQRERVELYATPGMKLLCVTPKTLLNDLDARLGTVNLQEFGAVLVDECHHAQGDHPLALLIDRLVLNHP